MFLLHLLPVQQWLKLANQGHSMDLHYEKQGKINPYEDSWTLVYQGVSQACEKARDTVRGEEIQLVNADTKLRIMFSKLWDTNAVNGLYFFKSNGGLL